jgi:membrane associated rhomboid family serine protease
VILLPIGRDDAVIQRHAWISYAIMALNVLVFLLMSIAEHGPSVERANTDWKTTMQFYVDHPYLRVPNEIKPLVPKKVRSLVANAQPPGSMLPYQIRDEQQELDRLAGHLNDAYHQLPLIRFGYIPAEGGWMNVLTSMFIHADFMHLLGNLLFFFVTGPFIEDVFGRPLFVVLYFTGGIVATLGYGARHPGSLIPLVGASGAIAAVMGAYLVRFLKSKMEFIFIPFLFRPRFNFRFFLPAFVVLPLWFLEQFWASSTAESQGAGVAFSAHVFGFGFGFFFALLVRFTKYEEKYVVPVVEKEVLWTADPRYMRALEAQGTGNFELAKSELTSLLKDQPQHFGAMQLAVDLGRATNDWRVIDAYAPRLLARYVEEKDDQTAHELINHLAGDRHERPPIPRFLARAAQYIERTGDHDWALMLYERVCELEPTGSNAVPSLVRLGNLRKLKGDVAGARVALTNARHHPDCTEEWANNIDARLAALAG